MHATGSAIRGGHFFHLMKTMKSVEELTVGDLARHPIWEYTNSESDCDETVVIPVRKIPVTSLQNRLVGTRVTLANGDLLWATLSNVSLTDIRATRQFLMISMENDGTWFHLARYFDVEYGRSGPEQLAGFLRLPVNGVFPIEYDISTLVRANDQFTRGMIPIEPEERLSLEELIALSLSSS
jgi:hypothetical protein